MQGGGEMGALMRSFDWSNSLLGPVAEWPQSLRTSVSTCLNSRFPILIWWGPELVMLYNDAYRQIIGGKHPAALGRPGRECWPEIWHIIGPMLQGVVERGEATWSNDLLLMLERSGYPEECYFTFSYSPIRNESGAIGGVFTPVADTTERVINERRMRTLRDLASRATTARGIQLACGAIAETLSENPQSIPFASLYLFQEAQTSASLVATAGIQTGAAAAQPVIRVSELPPPLAEAVIRPAVTHIEDLAGILGPLPCGAWASPVRSGVILPILMPGQTASIGFVIAGANPHKRLEASYHTFFELVGQHISSAIAAAREYEQERRRAEALAEIDRAKTTFFSNVSHEFRTPLTLLLAPLEDALANRHGILPMGAAASLSTSHRNALRLLKLVNTLLDFSRIEARRAQGRYQPVDLPALTAGLASNFRSVCERAGLQFHVHCPPLQSAKPAYVDPELWEKIVLNLLSNAFKFTLQGEIEVRLEADDHQAVLTVRDSGIGIPPDQLPHMFERFHRIEQSRGRTQEGTGIGLALVLELVKLHGGDVGVESSLGVGSTFTVAIPLGSGHLDPSRVVDNHEVARNPATSAAFVEEAMRWLPDEAPEDSQPLSYGRTLYENGLAVSGEQKPARILWADDNADMRAYVTRLLRGSFELEVVADGRSALEAVRARKPDLVLSDVMMPELDGFGLLREIRSDPRMSEIPVILLSARAGEEARIEGLEAGADDYLTKPFSSRELLAVVRSHIQLSRVREQAAEAQKQADRSAALLASIVESSDDAIISKDLTGRITSWNRGAERIFGYTAQEAVGRPVTMLMPEDRQDEEVEILASLQRGERVDHFETIRRRKDGEFLTVSLTISPLRDSSGRIVGASKIARDITPRKRADEAIRALNSRLKADLAALTRMQDLSTRLIQANAFSDLLKEILDAGITITAADMGNIQLVTSDGMLQIAAQRGFQAPFLEFFESVHQGRAACGAALEKGERVVVEDVAVSPLFVGTPALEVMLRAGARAVQSTPLVSRSGRLLGMFSTHYHAPHKPSDRDLSLLDVLARQAADLIERKRSEEIRAQLSAIVESSGDAIYLYDSTGTILTWNRAAEELYGYSEAEAVGRNVSLIVPPDARLEIETSITPAIFKGATIRNLETQRLRRDGSTFPALLTLSPLRDEAGTAVGVSVIARDISDQKRNEASLRETQKLESLGLLAGGIAHDFNNLLTGVIGNASLLAEELSAETAQAEMARSLIEAAERMARLSSQMLAYSGRGHFVVEAVDLSKQVTQIVGLIQASIPKNVELRLALEDNLPLSEVDVSQLQQVIMNLVINAAESIGGGTGTIEVRTGVETVGAAELGVNMAQTAPPPGKYVVITVRDTGCGMDEVTRAKIFDPFFTTKFTGRGLGLSSVLGIVRGHKGLITVESDPGMGSTFRVFFPIASVSRPAEAGPSASESTGSATILVVDDEDVVRRLAKAALQRLGYTVMTAENGREAVEVYAVNPDGIDLVLLDMTMPVMSGEEALRRLLDIRPNVNVLAMSGFHEREAAQRFGNRIAGFVQKPFTVHQLGAKISAAQRAAKNSCN
jgi:PAS domain S-box-containing protein